MELQQKYWQYLPKVDPALIDDLLLRQMENPNVVPMYLVEVFTKPGLNVEVRSYIIGKTGMSPAIYDNYTHYVTNQKLTLEMLRDIRLRRSDRSHRRIHWWPWKPSAPSPSIQKIEAAPKSKELPTRKESTRIVACTVAGIIGAIALAGFIISGGVLPDANVSQTIPPGFLHGYVDGPGGLPAIGATVLAVQQGTDFAASAFVSVNGQYFIDVPPGTYIVYVAYPDGTDKIATVEEEDQALS